VSGLTSSGLILTDGYTTITVDANATSFKFPTRLNEGYSYAVGVVTQPTQPIQLTCTVTNASGTIETSDITNVAVSCIPNKVLSGNITGLNGTLVLVNGNDKLTVTGTGGTTPFQFTGRVAENASYGITVLTQPANQACTVVNGVGTMGTSDINNIQVTCQ
jgi:cell division GTPase FtsZ